MRLKVILLIFFLAVIHITATPLGIQGIEATISSNNRTDFLHITLIFTEPVTAPVTITTNFINLTLKSVENTNYWFVNQVIDETWPVEIQIITVELEDKKFQNSEDFNVPSLRYEASPDFIVGDPYFRNDGSILYLEIEDFDRIEVLVFSDRLQPSRLVLKNKNVNHFNTSTNRYELNMSISENCTIWVEKIIVAEFGVQIEFNNNFDFISQVVSIIVFESATTSITNEYLFTIQSDYNQSMINKIQLGATIELSFTYNINGSLIFTVIKGDQYEVLYNKSAPVTLSYTFSSVELTILEFRMVNLTQTIFFDVIPPQLWDNFSDEYFSLPTENLIADNDIVIVSQTYPNPLVQMVSILSKVAVVVIVMRSKEDIAKFVSKNILNYYSKISLLIKNRA